MFDSLIDKLKNFVEHFHGRYGYPPSAGQARKYARALQNELRRMGKFSSHKARRGDRDVEIVKLVEFREPYIVTPSAVRLRVETSQDKLPNGIKIDDLCNNAVVETLSHTLEREVVVVRDNPRLGMFYEISSENTIRGIPSHVWSSKTRVPIDAPPLSYVVGISRRGSFVADFDKMYHLLLGGATQQGKSVHLWHILTSLAFRNPPDEMKLALFDLKDGIMFFPLRNLPHLLWPVVDDLDMAVQRLQDLVGEMHERYRTIRSKGQPNRTEYNSLGSTDEKMPAILVAIDELASITQNKRIKAEAEPLLTTLLRQGAAAGIHCILATQNPRVDVVTSDIRANVTEALAFRCSKRQHSEIILGVGGAEKIKVKGRAIFKFGGDLVEVQTPQVANKGGEYGIHNAISMIVQRWCVPEVNTLASGEVHLPTGGEVAALPAGGEVVTKNTTGNYRLPLPGEVIALPAGGEVAALPAGGEVAALPAGGEVAALPTSSEVVALPASGEVVALPAEVVNDMIIYSLKYLGGKFSIRDMSTVFKAKGISRYRLELVAKQLESAGVLSRPAPFEPRRVINLARDPLVQTVQGICTSTASVQVAGGGVNA